MSLKTKRTLSLVSSSSKQHRKYLGDPSDPHYVPKSPLIQRQKFSTSDEAELKHLCSLALANVPHSDDMMDDPFRYLGSQITAKQARKTSNNQPPVVVRQSKVIHQTNAPRDMTSSGNSTATPSETSKRETIQTNRTTPMTTPDISPDETDKRFSESGKRSYATHSSSLKTEIKAPKVNAVYSFLKDPAPTTRPQVLATKSLTHLPTLSRSKSKRKTADVGTQDDNAISQNPDFNKSLPAIPHLPSDRSQRVVEVGNIVREKPTGFSRMLKTVRLSRTHTTLEVPTCTTSADLSEQLEHLKKFQSTGTAKKQKFTFSSFFHKRAVPNNSKRATVG